MERSSNNRTFFSIPLHSVQIVTSDTFYRQQVEKENSSSVLFCDWSVGVNESIESQILEKPTVGAAECPHHGCADKVE